VASPSGCPPVLLSSGLVRFRIIPGDTPKFEDEDDWSDYCTEGLAFGCGNGELTGDGLAVSLAFDSSSLLASF